MIRSASTVCLTRQSEMNAGVLVKRYLVERGSRKMIALTAESEMIATSIVTRAEVAAAFAKAARTGLVTQDLTRSAQRSFAGDWSDLVRMPRVGA